MPYENRHGYKHSDYTTWVCLTCTNFACADPAHTHVLLQYKSKMRGFTKWEDAMKRPDAAKAVQGAKGLLKDEHATKNYPLLVQFLSDDTWDDGGERKPGSLTLFIEDGCWKACLNDRDADASLYVTGDNATACMKSLEARLAGSVAPEWRAWKTKGKKR